jgi:hypothetical protein
MISLREIVDGDNYLTKQKYASIVLSQLQKSMASYEVDMLRALNYKEDQRLSRIKINNSSLGAWYNIDVNPNQSYTAIVTCQFKKVPDSELTNKFTMADDPHLLSMPSKSMEPKDFNIRNPLIQWGCKLTRNENNIILIPEPPPKYAVLFNYYSTLKDVIAAIQEAILKDGGSDVPYQSPTPTPTTPSKKLVPV